MDSERANVNQGSSSSSDVGREDESTSSSSVGPDSQSPSPASMHPNSQHTVTPPTLHPNIKYTITSPSSPSGNEYTSTSPASTHSDSEYSCSSPTLQSDSQSVSTLQFVYKPIQHIASFMQSETQFTSDLMHVDSESTCSSTELMQLGSRPASPASMQIDSQSTSALPAPLHPDSQYPSSVSMRSVSPSASPTSDSRGHLAETTEQPVSAGAPEMSVKKESAEENVESRTAGRSEAAFAREPSTPKRRAPRSDSPELSLSPQKVHRMFPPQAYQTVAEILRDESTVGITYPCMPETARHGFSVRDGSSAESPKPVTERCAAATGDISPTPKRPSQTSTSTEISGNRRKGESGTSPRIHLGGGQPESSFPPQVHLTVAEILSDESTVGINYPCMPETARHDLSVRGGSLEESPKPVTEQSAAATGDTSPTPKRTSQRSTSIEISGNGEKGEIGTSPRIHLSGGQPESSFPPQVHLTVAEILSDEYTVTKYDTGSAVGSEDALMQIEVPEQSPGNLECTGSGPSYAGASQGASSSATDNPIVAALEELQFLRPQDKLPVVNCPERIILCVDCARDSAVPPGLDSSAVMTMANIVTALKWFIRTKSSPDRRHEFAIVGFYDTYCVLKNYTDNVQELLEILSSRLPAADVDVCDLRGFFENVVNAAQLPDLLPATKETHPPFIGRMIVIYRRSNAVPLFKDPESTIRKYLGSPYFFMDLLYIHDGKDQFLEVFNEWSQYCDKRAYVFCELRSDVPGACKCFQKLLAHPLQRVRQSSVGIQL